MRFPINQDVAGERERELDEYYREQRQILKAKAEEEARKILDQAKREAEELRKKAEEEIRRLREKAVREGREEGYQVALREAQEEAEKLREEARSVLRQAEEARKQTIRDMEAEIIKLALAIAERVIHQQVRVAEDTVLAVAREAISKVVDSETLIIYANPEDAALLQENLAELTDKQRIYVIGDEGISRGGCRIESDNGDVIATVEAQMEEIKKVLLGRESS
ncbi:flagellar biosynthesis/type III secretory pathway protein [Calderihabitans maritimus]|uniref:Flagellar biosynthesis/type III secretory pathway protein n=1 Tax=Calderihabitans maritimus TaxID=1246530 RepID=A0A1Z5HU29_9FIRM|nr:flagellar biosynthesis/type III secretory pathway protein [Calderihabitans maritimus]